jgi:hypothetical protein
MVIQLNLRVDYYIYATKRRGLEYNIAVDGGYRGE